MALISLGSSPIHYFSKSAVSSTQDLVTFQSLPAPFPVHNQIQHACVDTSGLCVAVSNSGLAATTTDFETWSSYQLPGRNSQFMKVIHANQFVAVGYMRQPDLSEQATVFTSTNAFDGFSWYALQILPNRMSCLMDVVSLPAGQLVAVGINTDTAPTQSVLTWGTLNTPWQVISLPPELQGGIYSVKYDAALNRLWLGGAGWVATGIWTQNSTTWTKTQLPLPAQPVNLIEYHAGKVTCVSRDQIFVSANLFDYDQTQLTGHAITAITVFDDQIILGTESFLNAHSAFVLNTADLSLQGVQSGVSARAFIVI